jgi:hypothetical protein
VGVLLNEVAGQTQGDDGEDPGQEEEGKENGTGLSMINARQVSPPRFSLRTVYHLSLPSR